MKKKPPVFEVRDLRVEREAVILRGLSWRVDAGQHWVVLGANGSGKTSLLNAVTGYLIPTRGEILMGSDRFGTADWREVRRAVGLVSSSLGHNIEPEMNAGDVVLSGRDGQINYWGRPNRQDVRQARHHLRQVHALHLRNRPWQVLSQGERQRVLIGRAIMSKPRILILDEPCAGLDPVAREDFLRFLGRLAREADAPSLVLVTHHVEEIVPLFTHVLLLSKGTALASGTKAATLTSRNLSVAFDAPIMLRRTAGRYQLRVGKKAGTFAA